MFSGLVTDIEDNVVVLKDESSGGEMLTGISFALMELQVSVLESELCDVETAFESD